VTLLVGRQQRAGQFKTENFKDLSAPPGNHGKLETH